MSYLGSYTFSSHTKHSADLATHTVPKGSQKPLKRERNQQLSASATSQVCQFSGALSPRRLSDNFPQTRHSYDTTVRMQKTGIINAVHYFHLKLDQSKDIMLKVTRDLNEDLVCQFLQQRGKQGRKMRAQLGLGRGIPSDIQWGTGGNERVLYPQRPTLSRAPSRSLP